MICVLVCKYVIKLYIFIKEHILLKKNGFDYAFSSKKYEPNYRRNMNTINNIKKSKPYFNEYQFNSWSRFVFLKCLKSENDVELNSLISHELCQKIKKSNNCCKKFLKHGKYKFIESLSDKKIFINFVDYYDYVEIEKNKKIVIALNCSVASNNLIEEDVNDISNITFLLTFVCTDEDTLPKINRTANCPNCGAPQKFTTFGKCIYCNEFVSLLNYNWKLYEIEKYK